MAKRTQASQAAADDSRIADFTKEEELTAYRSMLLIRRFEEKAGQLYGMGHIGGCHLYIGQEAVVVGMQMALKDGDQVITSYRDHSRTCWPAAWIEGVMAELTGRTPRLFQGKGVDAHVQPREELAAATASSVPRCRSAPASPSPTAIAAMTWSASPISARAPPIRARFTKPSTWRHVEAAGGVRHREQPVARHGHGGDPLACPCRGAVRPRRASAFPASRWTAWMCGR